MKQMVKRCLHAIAPKWTTALLSARGRAHAHRVVKEWGCVALNQRLIDRFGAVVQEGPFAGMVLSPMTFAEHLGPYLLGVYESELDDAWETIWQGRYAQIVDIGSKFGYYAVGLGRRYPDAAVLAFDTDWWARAAVAEMAAANGVQNVAINGFCEPRWLAANLVEPAFLLSDCEGFEGKIFAASMIPSFRTAVLLIETHDCFVPGTTAALRKNLASTHRVITLGTDAPRRTSMRDLGFLTKSERELANQEVRGPQEWLLGLPKDGPNRALTYVGRARSFAAAGVERQPSENY